MRGALNLDPRAGRFIERRGGIWSDPLGDPFTFESNNPTSMTGSVPNPWMDGGTPGVPTNPPTTAGGPPWLTFRAAAGGDRCKYKVNSVPSGNDCPDGLKKGDIVCWTCPKSTDCPKASACKKVKLPTDKKKVSKSCYFDVIRQDPKCVSCTGTDIDTADGWDCDKF